MKISELKRNLRFIYKHDVRQPITPFIWGVPGIGKSASLRQIAEELTKYTGVKYHFIDLRLSQLESADLRGIPVPDEKEGICRWLPPEFLPFEGIKKFEGTYGILLLDEMNRARTDVLQAAFQLVLDRSVGEHNLLDTWFIAAAGNLGDADGTDVNEMDAALNNRFAHFDVDYNLDDWVDWAQNADVHTDIITFIQSKPRMLYLKNEDSKEDKVFVTPRSWEKFSDILKNNSEIDPADITISIGPSILNGAFGSFLKYLESKEIISPQDVCEKYVSKDSKGVTLKKESVIKKKIKGLTREQIYALNAEIVPYVTKKYTSGLSKKKQGEYLENVFSYCKEILEHDNYIAFLQSITKACNQTGCEFLDDYLKKFPSESKLIVEILSKKK